jgi:hypothetical protein
MVYVFLNFLAPNHKANQKDPVILNFEIFGCHQEKFEISNNKKHPRHLSFLSNKVSTRSFIPPTSPLSLLLLVIATVETTRTRVKRDQ